MPLQIGEKANLQEVVYVLKNLINAEEHLLESAKKVEDKEDKEKFSKIADAIRLVRQKMVGIFFKFKGTGEQWRSEAEEVWCAVKHLLSASYHLLEVAQKLSRDEKFEELYQTLDLMKETDFILDVLISEYLLGGGAVEGHKRSTRGNEGGDRA